MIKQTLPDDLTNSEAAAYISDINDCYAQGYNEKDELELDAIEAEGRDTFRDLQGIGGVGLDLEELADALIHFAYYPNWSDVLRAVWVANQSVRSIDAGNNISGILYSTKRAYNKQSSTYTKQAEQSRRFQARKQGVDFNGTEPAGNGTLFNGVAFEQRYGNYYATGWNAESCKVLRVAVLDSLPEGWKVVVNGDTHYIYPTLNDALESASLYCK